MEYKAFTGLPWNDAIRAMLPADARGPDAGMVFLALNNPQPDKPSPGSITLYCLKDWAGTMYLPEGEQETEGLQVGGGCCLVCTVHSTHILLVVSM